MPNMSGSHYAHVVVLRICRFVHLSNVVLSFAACRLLLVEC